jgi:hypothetical protein
MNKKPTRCTIDLKSLNLYCILNPLKIFRALLRPSSGAYLFCTYSLQSQCVFGWVVFSSFGMSPVTDQSWKIQPTQRHKVTGGCMCRIRRPLMMGARVPETCHCSDRPKLEDTTNPMTHGGWRLYLKN